MDRGGALKVEKTILVVGTYDTKDSELDYLAHVIRRQGGKVLTMDVSVLGNISYDALRFPMIFYISYDVLYFL